MKYLRYLKYLLQHKKNVFIECIKKGLFLHAFSHDLSKFSPKEFISYAKNFFGTEEDKKNSNFDFGWFLHYRRNKHHWDYWINKEGKALDMPMKYIKQMLCDWSAMSRKFGDTPAEFYFKNKNKMNLHENTIIIIENLLSKES